MDPNSIPTPGGFNAPPMSTPPMMGFPPMMPQFSVPPPGFAGFPSIPPCPPITSANPIDAWTEHKAPDGRTYYYNGLTKQSSWQKPDLLKTPAELLLSQCPWKEYTADNGKIYYHNITTKESRWVVPPELDEIKAKIAAEDTGAATPTSLSNNERDRQGITSPATPSSEANSPTVAVASPGGGASSFSCGGGKSALESAMAATLAAISIPTPPPRPTDDDGTNQSLPDCNTSDIQAPDTPEPPPGGPGKTYKDKKEAMEAFKEMLKDNSVASNATWEQCVRAIQADSRYDALKRLNERKQVFNAYKTQKQKDEKEESRLRAKKAKETLEEFLMRSDRITSTTKYYKLDEIFVGLEVWDSVGDGDRRDIYEDVVFALAKREKEEAKVLKKRNMKKLAEVMNNMPDIRFDTTWSEAQTLLLGNATFKNDVNLLAMDKEDALVVFEEHIRELEKEDVDEREQEKKRTKRQGRKNRDHFLVLLDALHEEGKLTSMSLWVELYPVISADVRFSAMLGQAGSTPLDLFKFYVEDLKARFHDEKKVIKEILKSKEFDVLIDTTFEQFATVVCEDKKSATLDAGNVKLTYNSLLEKAEAKEKERVKEEGKRLKKLELGLKTRLRELNFDYELTFDEARKLLADEEEFRAFASDSERIKVYKSFQHEMEESCSHHHSRSKKSKKSKKSKRYKSSSNSDSDTGAESKEGGGGNNKKNRSDDSAAEDHKKSSKKSKKKHKRRETPSPEERTKRRGSDEARGGDLSESELEKQRALLLEQLKTEGD